MAKKLAMLDYSFMFPPSDTWSRGTDFEADLARFFKAKGYQAEIIQTTGGTGRRVLWISRVDNIPTPKPPKQRPIQKVLKELGK